MAIRNTSWARVEPGQIVSFVYKSQNEKRGYKRTVLLINPDWRYRKKSTGRIKRYVVGLQLDTAISAPLTTPKLERLLGLMPTKSKSGLELEEGAVSVELPDKLSRAETKQVYRKIRKVVKQFKNYRTFDRRECMKRRVILELDYKRLPKELLSEFQDEQMKNLQRLVESET